MQTTTIGGVAYYTLKETTLEKDAAILRIIDGVDIKALMMSEGEDGAAFVTRIVTELLLAGKAFPLLGCFLVPEGKEWNPTVAAETAAALSKITDPGDKNKIRNAFVPILHDFFVTGLSSVVISRRYSSQLRGIVGQLEKTGARWTLASGLRSLVSWLAGIIGRPWKSRGGRSVKPS